MRAFLNIGFALLVLPALAAQDLEQELTALGSPLDTPFGEYVETMRQIDVPLGYGLDVARIAKQAGVGELEPWNMDSEAARIRAAIDADCARYGLTASIRQRYADLYALIAKTLKQRERAKR